MKAVGADTNYALQVRYTLRAFTRALAVVAGSVGLTAAEFRLLRTMGENEAPTQTELAALAAMDRPYVSALVRRMTAKGMLRSERNASDRRRTDIVLTAEGRRVLDMLSRQLATVNQESVAGIASRELAVFMSVATRMQANLEHYF